MDAGDYCLDFTEVHPWPAIVCTKQMIISAGKEDAPSSKSVPILLMGSLTFKWVNSGSLLEYMDIDLESLNGPLFLAHEAVKKYPPLSHWERILQKMRSGKTGGNDWLQDSKEKFKKRKVSGKTHGSKRRKDSFFGESSSKKPRIIQIDSEDEDEIVDEGPDPVKQNNHDVIEIDSGDEYEIDGGGLNQKKQKGDEIIEILEGSDDEVEVGRRSPQPYSIRFMPDQEPTPPKSDTSSGISLSPKPSQSPAPKEGKAGRKAFKNIQDVEDDELQTTVKNNETPWTKAKIKENTTKLFVGGKLYEFQNDQIGHWYTLTKTKELEPLNGYVVRRGDAWDRIKHFGLIHEYITTGDFRPRLASKDSDNPSFEMVLTPRQRDGTFIIITRAWVVSKYMVLDDVMVYLVIKMKALLKGPLISPKILLERIVTYFGEELTANGFDLDGEVPMRELVAAHFAEHHSILIADEGTGIEFNKMLSKYPGFRSEFAHQLSLRNPLKRHVPSEDGDTMVEVDSADAQTGADVASADISIELPNGDVANGTDGEAISKNCHGQVGARESDGEAATEVKNGLVLEPLQTVVETSSTL